MDIRQTKLPNGIRIISERMQGVRSASLGFWLTCGSRQEDDEKAGVAHLIEHMLFKGTGRRSARQLAQEIDHLGGNMNAYTSSEYTFYYIKTLDSHLAEGFDILSDMLLNPLLLSADINKEKKVILQEYDMYADNPEDLAQGKYFAWIWNKHPLGRSIIGSKKTIRSLDLAAVKDFRAKFYTPDNLIIAATGNMEHDRVVDLATRYLGSFTGKSAQTPNVPAGFSSGNKFVVKDTEQMQVIWGVPGIAYANKDRYEAGILNNILGATGSSRLFQSIREKAGLAYSIYSSFDSYSDSGVFSVNAGIKPEDDKKLLYALDREIADISQKGITEEELAHSKVQITSSLLMGLETSEGRMQRLGKLLVMKRPIQPLEKIVEKVEGVSLADVNKLAKKLFAGVQPAVLRLGPKPARKSK